MGDPGGIGPEVLVRALADPRVRTGAGFVVFGSMSAMLAGAETAGVEPFWWRVPREGAATLLPAALTHDVVLVDDDGVVPEPLRRWAATNSKVQGELSFRWVEEAIGLCKRPAGDPLRAHGMVTGPISKKAWEMAGRGRWPGHTELLAERFGARRHAMAFEGPRLRVVLATVHVPLMDVRNVLTIGRVHEAIDLGHEWLVRSGVARPRVAVCGLNPHAGEGGLLGDEEVRVIEPAIELAVRQGMDVSGPWPGDTVFNAAVGGKFDLVVAMYHDQGLIPVKLLARDQSVNLTLGLPTVRTSPDHGTAFDIALRGAGRGTAEEGSMKSAILAAVRMLTGERAGLPGSGRRPGVA